MEMQGNNETNANITMKIEIKAEHEEEQSDFFVKVDNNVLKPESYIDLKEEQPNCSHEGHILEFEEEAVCIIKRERNEPVESVSKEKEQDSATKEVKPVLKLESYIDLKEEQPNCSHEGHILEFEEEAVCIIKRERTKPVESVSKVKERDSATKEVKPVLKPESYIDPKEEQPNCSHEGHILEFEEEPVCIIKRERNEPVESVSKEKEQDIATKEVKPDTPKKIKKFICVECNHGFSQRIYLIDHFGAVHKKKKFKCEECHKAFTKSGNLKEHIKSVHNKLRYACEECEKTFSTLGNLNKHVNFIHRQVNIFSCDECDKVFPNQVNFKQHIDQVHRKVREYECNQCKRAFFTRVHLNTHVNSIHRKLKPFECEKCNRSFALRGNLTRHTNSIHLNKKFTCAECNKSFNEKGNLIKHINVIHRYFRPFICLKCKHAFGHKHDLKKHKTSGKCVK